MVMVAATAATGVAGGGRVGAGVLMGAGGAAGGAEGGEQLADVAAAAVRTGRFGFVQPFMQMGEGFAAALALIFVDRHKIRFLKRLAFEKREEEARFGAFQANAGA
jgi:hypothetical protein